MQTRIKLLSNFLEYAMRRLNMSNQEFADMMEINVMEAALLRVEQCEDLEFLEKISKELVQKHPKFKIILARIK